ncbi:hypothetical protein H6G89_14610 [Oscillatoria sp. FACHB-1407]|uniref:hypothetical protein n=1 Tax=Oscillatoria sp. FACHB-1407 TaxID=2692847 RepID=UPI0016894971|nr:hypothetical protein [Oscillatoria sp. FACHB-1407]MBD2462277.1 hypothetical protein [Oscillatoria sp. FACHB-1407]
MAIGGKRPGAGRKSAWRSPTKMMRLPARFETQIVDFAKALDSDSESLTRLTEQEIKDAIAAVVVSVRPGDRRAANLLFKKLLAKLRTA